MRPDAPRGASREWSIERLEELCDELTIDRRHATVAAPEAAIDDPAVLARALSAAACAAGDHRAEASVEAWLAERSEDDVGLLGSAWLGRLRALQHEFDGSEEDRSGLARELRDAALLGAAEVERACRAAERSAAACRVLVDPIIELLAAAERELGEPSSPATLDLERRRSARAAHPARNLTFVDKHGDGVAAVSRRDGRAWWLQRFVEKHGVEPPSGWWQEEPDLPLGGRLSAEHRGDDWFDAEDERAFAAEMETRYRLEAELPGPGEGWVSQAHLTHCLRTVLPGHEIVSEARLEWLGGQRLDAYVPSLGLALEYQGEQHFVPLPHWGGEAGLAARRELDERKRDACARAGVRLLEWRYDEPVSVESVRARLERAGVIPS